VAEAHLEPRLQRVLDVCETAEWTPITMLIGYARTSILDQVAGFESQQAALNEAGCEKDCCADLEERIAELEATTARKGNRKVSLTISGWVGEQVMWWDDGSAKGTYVTGLGTTLSSHVTFSGQATIMPGWYAGYRGSIPGGDQS
jgi:hypothetical protein